MEAVTVWAVRLREGQARERKGSLSLEPDALVFTADDGYSHRRIALSDIRKVRRVLGSPVLVVQDVAGGGPSRTAFYFTQPPPLDYSGPVSRRKMRRRNVQYLGVLGREKKDEVRHWERAVREAAAAARGTTSAGG